jgi:hypothetical protein
MGEKRLGPEGTTTTRGGTLMAQCPKCGLAAEPAMKFCTGCGSSIVEKAPPAQSQCSKCDSRNPVGSKFCAACGGPLPQAGADSPQTKGNVLPPCAACGTANPEGSKFCIRCGKPIGTGALSFAASSGGVASGTWVIPPPMPQPLSMELQRVRIILFLGVAVNLIGIFQLYRLMSGVQQLWGLYADTSGLAFLMFIDIVIAAFLSFSAVQLGKGDLKYGKMGVAVMAVLAGIAILLGGMTDGFSFVLNVVCLAGGVWGWTLIRRVEQTTSLIV